MKYDLILAGVGGQGVLSVAAIISIAAMKEGFGVRQSEVHGMSQRGGAVLANIRISDKTIESDLVPKKSADMILSMEPLESLRYLDYLAKDGVLITSLDPVENIPNYPDFDTIYKQIDALPNKKVIRAKEIALKAGNARSTNVVIVAAASEKLPISKANFEEAIRERFASKGEPVVEINLNAFRLGREV